MTQLHAISGAVFKDMLITGAAVLERNKAMVDSLNVFPVPDGDTGTNMSMTMNTAAKELTNVDTSQVSFVSSALAKGALRGARGNSGVILSQLFRGMSQALEGQTELNAQLFAQALMMGSEAAYKAVMRPKEGTILTVAKHVAKSAKDAADSGANVYKLIDVILKSGEEILEKTPDMLPVLKEAGVVDSGGKGLLLIYRGFKMALDGDSIDDYVVEDLTKNEFDTNEEVLSVNSTDDIRFAYCTEFFIEHLSPDFSQNDMDSFKNNLERIGDSLVVVGDSEMIKVHVHTNVPGKALQMALRLGEINGVKIENMKEQHRRLIDERKAREKEFGMVAVSVGEGVDKVFKDLAIDSIVKGGQTMNPSAMDIENAIKKVNARNVFVFPNNKNIILAAQQAAEMVEKSQGIKVVVIPTNSVMQGISAAVEFNPEATLAQNSKALNEAASQVTDGAVTYAIRTTTINGKNIKEGDFMGLLNGDLEVNGKDINKVSLSLIDKMMQDDSDYLTIFYGADITEDDAKRLVEKVSKKYPDIDIVLQHGGQPLYSYLMSVE